MVTLIAEIKAKDGKEKEMESLFAGLIQEVEKEEGTLEYVLHKSLNDPCKFMFYEVYKDNDAVGLHNSTDYFKKAMTALAPLLDGKPKIELYEEVKRIAR